MCLEQVSTTEEICPCGCGKTFKAFSGRLSYGEGRSAMFQAAHLDHDGGDPHIWLAFRTGSWFEDEVRDCWIAAHMWIDEGQVITRVEDAASSPFFSKGDGGHRLLTRNEVVAKPGGVEWVIARRMQFEEHHQATQAFISGPPPNTSLERTRER